MAKGKESMKVHKAHKLNRQLKNKSCYVRSEATNIKRELKRKEKRELARKDKERRCTYCGHHSATLIVRTSRINGKPIGNLCAHCHRRAKRGKILC